MKLEGFVIREAWVTRRALWLSDEWPKSGVDMLDAIRQARGELRECDGRNELPVQLPPYRVGGFEQIVRSK